MSDRILRNIFSLKDTKCEYNNWFSNDLYRDYDLRARIASENPNGLLEDLLKIPQEEIESARKVSTTLKYKGNLRVSWSFDMKYNKNIDLIFFPEDNPYINYVVLYAKDFPKSIDTENGYGIDRVLSENSLKISYDINYDFVKAILSQSDLSKYQQEKFFQVRFGSVFIPMEIEFEWYSAYWSYYDKPTSIEKTILFPKYDKYLNGILDGGESLQLCLGIIKSHKLLPTNTPLNFPPFIEFWDKKTFYSQIFAPLPTTALATTQTNMGDYLINVRDKPDAKEGKIITQLLARDIKIPSDLCSDDYGNHDCNGAKPLYAPMVKKGQEWYKKDHPNSGTDAIGYMAYYLYKTKLSYFQKEKQKLINPLVDDDYLIFVWNIESNDWAKVWVLKMIRDSDTAVINGRTKLFKETREEYPPSYGEFFFFLNGSYKQTFLESPSTLKLYEGYIHTSGLGYFCSFGENYIRK